MPVKRMPARHDGSLPEGPRTVQEMLDWPTRAIAAMRDIGQFDTWLSNLRGGLIVGTHFSGLLTAELALEQLVHATADVLERNGQTSESEQLHGRLMSSWTCDKLQESRDFAMSWPKSRYWHDAGGCCFGDIFDSSTDEMVEKFNFVDRAKEEGRGRHAVQDTQTYMFRHVREIVEESACFRHRKFCKSHEYTPPEDFHDPVTIEVAGTPCVGWSILGKREGVLHDSHLAFLAWAAKTRLASPMIIVHECTAAFPVSLLEYWFDDMYELYSMILDPLWMGHSTQRPNRRFTWLIRKDCRFTGSADEFNEMFAARTTMLADAFYCAPSDVLQEGLNVIALSRGFAPQEVSRVKDWSIYYPPGTRERMDGHLRMWMKKRSPDMLDSPRIRARRKVSAEALNMKYIKHYPIIADLDQNPGYGPTASLQCPTLVSHGTLHNFFRKRCMVGEEHLLSMGFPIFDEDCFLKSVVGNVMSKRMMKQMAGNAMYLPLIGIQLLYLISHLHKTNGDNGCKLRRMGRLASNLSFSSGGGMGSPGHSSTTWTTPEKSRSSRDL
ncbi:unnamed protein product [Symbiodinium sp. CCMP2592]|nr:unnamed protein product [Symbiodinium sp. CCMP2592]